MVRFATTLIFGLMTAICFAQTYKVDSVVVNVGTIEFTYQYPVFEGGIDSLLQKANTFVRQQAEKAVPSAVSDASGKSPEDFAHQEYHNLQDAFWNGRLLSFQADGEEMAYKAQHWMWAYGKTYDVVTEKEVELADLFLPGADYEATIWYEIKNMARREKVPMQIETEMGELIELDLEFLRNASFYLSNEGVCFSMIYENMLFGTSFWNDQSYVCVPYRKLRGLLQPYLR